MDQFCCQATWPQGYSLFFEVDATVFTQQFTPRYLLPIHPEKYPQEQVDVLVIGSGIAGARAALSASADGADVLLLTKETFRESNTNYALGGIAAALAPGDSPAKHARDTVEAGKGLCDEDLVNEVVKEGQELVRELIEWGTGFDHQDGRIDFTKEGGHSRRRILHADGDQTGKAISSELQNRVQSTPEIEVREGCFVIDLLTDESGCCGVFLENQEEERAFVYAPSVVLCSGGAGQLYRETTNPPVATGDGLAMAYRAGAVLRDLEFYQFHPTTLYIAGSGRSLISESVRGEGAKLVDREGNRFMEEIHPEAELAPRDVVSRGIVEHLANTGHTCVYLDLSDLDTPFVRERFPRLTELCEEFEIDIASDPVPVHPSAHYQIGGVRTDDRGRTSIPGLLAAGEVASTKFHGANRLGSNSLLEGLVFGCRAGQVARARASSSFSFNQEQIREPADEKRPARFIDLDDMLNSVQSLNWRQCGIIRSGDGLEDALYKLNFWCSYLLDRKMKRRKGWEIQNLYTISRLVTLQARKRNESRGVHYRSDYPETDDGSFRSSSCIRRETFPEEMEKLIEVDV